MDPRASIVLVGLSHRTAPVAVRERFVVGTDDLVKVLASLRALHGIEECFVLSTCNRTEALVVVPHGLDAEPALRASLFRNLDAQFIYAYSDVQALIHVFRVAAGLDSLVVGESEVLAQMKRGIDVASGAGTLGSVLRPLLQQALHVGKRVRTETELGQGTLSVARVGIDVAARAFGTFEDERALVIGAGETGVLVARHLKDMKIGALVFANRTLERAQAVAAEIGGEGRGLEQLSELVEAADIVVACVEATSPTLEARHFDRRALRRRDKPLLVLDLSVPRAVAPEVAELGPNILLYDLDDLQRVVVENEKARASSVEGTTEILVSELHKYLALRTYAAFTPAITALRERFESLREDTLDQVAGARSDPKDVQLAHELTKRLLDAALEQMKDSARRVRSAEALEGEYQRFLENL